MHNHMVRVDAGENVFTTIGKMNHDRISSVIVEEFGRPVGVITERDIVQFAETRQDPTVVRAREIMSQSLTTVEEDTTVEEAVRIMVDSGVRRVPVLRGEQLVGIVTSTDILRAVAKGMLAREVYIYLSDIFRKEPSFPTTISPSPKPTTS